MKQKVKYLPEYKLSKLSTERENVELKLNIR